MNAILLSGILMALSSVIPPSSDRIPNIHQQAIVQTLPTELPLERKKEQGKMPEYLLILMRASSLDRSAVGRAGIRTETYKAFERASAAGNSIRPQLETMVQSSTPAGRLYAAILLQRIDRTTGEKALKQLQSDQTQVAYLSGCFVENYKVSELATKILQGELSL